MLKGDFKFLKNMNEQIVLNLIRENDIISSSELVQATGMRPSTIFNILKDLSNKELVNNLGKGESTDKGGKKPFIWKLNGSAHYVVGLDVESKEIKAVVMNLEGQVITAHSYPMSVAKDLPDLVQNIKLCVDSVIIESKINREKFIGIGIAFAGVINSKAGKIVTTDVIPRLNFDIMTSLEEVMDLPVMIDNNANVAALGAAWVGKGKGFNNSITVLAQFNQNVGGIGIGLILNGELHRGKSSCAGELNKHLPKIRDVLISINNRLEEGHVLRNYCDNISAIDLKVIIEAAKQNDQVANVFIKRLGHIIGTLISTPIALLNPDGLIISGDISELGDLIIEPVRDVIELELLSLTSEALSIVTSVDGYHSVAVGAGCLILHEYFKVPQVSVPRNWENQESDN